MNKKLLTLEDLYNFYSLKKKSMKFSSEKSGYNIVVQTNAVFEIDENLSEGLLYGHIKAFHDLDNRNKSYIETDVLKEKMMSVKDRPIMADIVETEKKDENGIPIKDFSGHTMYYDEDLKKMVYKEIPVGHFVNPDSIKLEYDEKLERNFVCSDVVIYEEYTDACEILRRRKTVDCSVELSIREMHWDNSNHILHLDDFYVQGCTLLGEQIAPGMQGSKLTLKDFSEENNSIFSSISDDKRSKLIETLDNLNNTLLNLSNFNINHDETINIATLEKGGNDKKMFEELLSKYNKNIEEIDFDYKNMTDSELEEKFSELFGKCGDDNKKKKCEEDDEEEDNTPEVETPENSDDQDNDESTEENEACKKRKCEEELVGNISRTYQLSHDDIRCSLYKLLEAYEEVNNDFYWILEVFDSYFVYQGCMGDLHGQKYSVNDENVAFEGEPYKLFAEYLTESEKAELDSMRSSYSSISEKLAKYVEAEELADKMTVFSDKAYENYLETEEFKNLMKEETLKKFTKDELSEKADAALGKVVKTTKTFTLNKEEKEVKTPSFFAFSRAEQNTSFLDGLLKK